MGPHAQRLERLRAAFDAAGVDGLLVSQPESRYYLSGYTGHDLPPRDSAGYLLVTSQHAALLTDRRTDEQARAEAADFEVVAYDSSAHGAEAVRALAHRLGVRRLGFEAVHLPFATWRDVGREAPFELVPTEALVDDLRVVKDAAELETLQAAVDVLDRCFTHVVGSIQPGMTERQVAREVERYLIEHADGPSFPSIVASGPNGSMPHAVPTDRLLREGDAITLDIGARVRGYCSDMTRTFCLGEPSDGLVRELYEVVLEAQQATIAGLRPGMTGREADALARDLIEARGYGEAFTHSTGHGIGLEVHEPPWVSRVRGDATLRPGMVFSVEPGIYLPGKGGVRIEDLVVLEADGARVLSHSPRGLDGRS